MAHHRNIAHFDTFARLRRATRGDLPHIGRFCQQLPAGSSILGAGWDEMLHREDTYMLLATECQLVVGIAALQHAPSAPEARLAFLFVLPDARGRGVGQLLLSSLVDRARSEGAALVQALDDGQGIGIAKSLSRAGFFDRGGGLWSCCLWNGHIGSGYGSLDIPEHDPVNEKEAAAQTLLVAMGTLDRSILLTRQARQVIGHELDQTATPGAAAMALAAARRRYFVWIDSAEAAKLGLLSTPETAERIGSENERLTPERILGHLSRGNLCLIRLAVSRLSGKLPQWYAVNGFDGYLFRLHDVTRGNTPQDPIVLSASELRQGTGSLAPDDFVIMARPR